MSFILTSKESLRENPDFQERLKYVLDRIQIPLDASFRNEIINMGAMEAGFLMKAYGKVLREMTSLLKETGTQQPGPKAPERPPLKNTHFNNS